MDENQIVAKIERTGLEFAQRQPVINPVEIGASAGYGFDMLNNSLQIDLYVFNVYTALQDGLNSIQPKLQELEQPTFVSIGSDGLVGNVVRFFGEEDSDPYYAAMDVLGIINGDTPSESRAQGHKPSKSN